MRFGWVVIRWVGLLALLVLALLLGERWAGAQEKNTKDQTVDARPNSTGQSAVAPAGTSFGSATPLRNLPPPQADSPRSPTPQGYPFGARGGSYAPAGPGNSGATNPNGFIFHQ
jgi:hypothetical protein